MGFATQIEEVLKLIAETGDRCIVVSEGHEPFVLMDIAQYRTLLKSAAGKEKLSNLTETELLDKINQDIAEWRESRADDVSEYELSQFRIDPPVATAARVTPGSPKPATPTARPVRPMPNLPFVDDAQQGEYRLEPLGQS